MKPSILIDSIGLNSKSADDTNFVLFHCQGIQDIEEFYEYCMQKKDMIEYQSKKERFVTLSRLYKKLEEKEKLPHHTANTFTDKIIQKIGQYKVQLKNAIEQGQQAPLSRATIRKDDEVEKLFSDTEIKALAALKVSSSSIIEMYEVGILKDNLINVFMKYHLENVNNKALSDGEKKVKALLGGGK